MASYCPHCGNPSPDEARYCMKCGRERLPEPVLPPAPPPAAATAAPAPAPALPSAAPPVPALGAPPAAPPAYAPGPVQPSPVGEFIGRVLRGGWPAAAKATMWPAGLLLVLAALLAIPSYGQEDEVVVGWSDRLRIALALLLQGVGGGVEVKAVGSPSPYERGDYSGGYSGGYSDGDRYSGSGTDSIGQGMASFSVVPMTVTVLVMVALLVGARMLRRRAEGLEAAVRMSLLFAGEVLLLGLFAQPEVEGISFSSAPLLAALGALALSLAVSSGVLQRDQLAAWLAQRPAALSAVRALGTAVRALGVVLALCSLTGFILYANVDEVDGQALLIALPLLPNIGFAVLGVSWGAPVDYDVGGQFGLLGPSTGHGSIGLGEIADVWGDGAVVWALVLGLLCALILGVFAARRSPDRRDQVQAGVFALGLILLGAGLSGISAEGGGSEFGATGTSELAPDVAEALLFGLLWVGGATFLGPYVLRMVGRQPAVVPLPGYDPGGTWSPAAQPMPAAPFAAHPAPAAPGVVPAPAASPEAPAAHGSSKGLQPAGPPIGSAAGGGPAGPLTLPDASAGAPPAPGAVAGHDAAGRPAAGFVPGQVSASLVPPDRSAGASTAPAAGPEARAPSPDSGPVPVPYIPHPQAPGGPQGGYAPYTVQLGAASAISRPDADTDVDTGARAERRRKVLIWTATLTAAFVIGGGATAGVLVLKNKDDRAPAAQQSQKSGGTPRASASPAPSRSSAAASPTPSASASADASSTPAGDGTLPAGMVLKQDPAGFTVGVMEGWSRRQAGSQVFYEAPTGGAYLQIGVIKNTPMTSYENFLGLEKKHLETPRTRYERKQLTQNTYQGRPGALWEFVHVPEPDEGDLERHVIDQAFVAADGTEYAILAAGRADQWDADKDVVFSTAVETFRID